MAINIREVIPLNCIVLELAADTKAGIIGEMIDLLVRVGKVPDRAAALKAIYERERKMSTGMQNGIAIPHGKTDTVPQLVTSLALRRTPVDFDALDGKPCNIFIMTLSPSNRAGPHIQFLSEISRLLGDAGRRERILAAASPEAVMEALTD